MKGQDKNQTVLMLTKENADHMYEPGPFMDEHIRTAQRQPDAYSKNSITECWQDLQPLLQTSRRI